MKNKNKHQKGFVALTFVIIISAFLVFLVLDDSFEEQALETELGAVVRHYENYYSDQSKQELDALTLIQNS